MMVNFAAHRVTAQLGGALGPGRAGTFGRWEVLWVPDEQARDGTVGSADARQVAIDAAVAFFAENSGATMENTAHVLADTVTDWANIKRKAGPNPSIGGDSHQVYCFGSTTRTEPVWLRRFQDEANGQGCEFKTVGGLLYVLVPR